MFLGGVRGLLRLDLDLWRWLAFRHLTRVAVALVIRLTTAFGTGFVILLPRGVDWTKETLRCRIVSTRFAVPEERRSSLRTVCVFPTRIF